MKKFFLGVFYLFLGALQAITLIIALVGFYLIYAGKPASTVVMTFIPLCVCSAIAWYLLFRQQPETGHQ